MRSLFCAGMAALAICAAATGCGSKAPEPASGEDAGTVARAQAEIANPPPVYVTQASSLAGVATWALRRGSGSPDAVIEGRDAAGQTVVLVAEAYGSPSEAIGVAYWADSELHTTFDAVRGAIARDLDPTAGDVQPKATPPLTGQEQLVVDQADLVKCMAHPLAADCTKLTACPDGPFNQQGGATDTSWKYSTAYVFHPSPDWSGPSGPDEYCYRCGAQSDSPSTGDGINAGFCRVQTPMPAE